MIFIDALINQNVDTKSVQSLEFINIENINVV